MKMLIFQWFYMHFSEDWNSEVDPRLDSEMDSGIQYLKNVGFSLVLQTFPGAIERRNTRETPEEHPRYTRAAPPCRGFSICFPCIFFIFDHY